MADYSIIVQLGTLVLVDKSAEEIRDALETLEGDDRLDASAIKNLPTGTGSMTASEIVSVVNASEEVFDKENLEPLVKTDVFHAEKALNLIFTGDPRNSTFQAEFEDSILANDYILVAQVNQASTLMENGDWLIARTDNPGWSFGDTSKWERKRFLPTSYNNVFRQHDSSADNQSGIESIPGGSQATGNHSFAPGYMTIASGEGATALGKNSKASRTGETSESSGMFSTTGDNDRHRNNMRLLTTNAAPTEMVLPFKFACNADTTYSMRISVVARVGTGGGNAKGARAKEWTYKFLISSDDNGVIYHDGGLLEESLNINNPAISASVTVVPVIGDATTPPAPTVFRGLKIQCTGLINTSIWWSTFIETFEIKS